ncbi:hypothetical protein N0V83_008303 [Neocucurbitaria cava]|uniref:Uncharacterized protein n=1 Tax=Neocucurbitaria cava TaxID=798079 RepID=A0A9W8Y2R8_9PLEO|nr:hypothetical protein N0V83_008303 [Neocucurbitaria cava]
MIPLQFEDNRYGRSVKHPLDLRVLGVSGGSGLNGLDYALVHYHQNAPTAPLQVELLQYSEIAIPPAVRNPIIDLLHKVPRKPSTILRLNALLGHMFSSGIISFCRRHNIVPTSIDLVGTHAPNLQRLHVPQVDDANTQSLGWNAAITAETGVTTVSNFLILDCGVARPHVPPIAFVDRLLLRHPTKFRACLNIQEMASISFISAFADGDSHSIISHSCGPGSLLIDYAVQYCTSNSHHEDYNGEFGSKGQVNEEVVHRFLMANDYMRTTPPENMAQEMFGDHEAQRLINQCICLNMSDADIIATVTRITTENILKQYLRLLHRFFPSGQEVAELFICGPSAKNMNIVEHLEAKLPESVITKPLEDVGIPGDAKESFCCAHLALEAVLGTAIQLDSTLSARAPVHSKEDAVSGRIVHGTNWEDIMVRIYQFSGGEPLHITKDVRVARKLDTVILSRESSMTTEGSGARDAWKDSLKQNT